MKGWISKLKRALKTWLRGDHFDIVRVEELPDVLEGRTLYAIGEEQPWAAALLCPCGCKDTIQLSLLTDDYPRWRLRIDARGAVSLYPSVWRTVSCRSHFFLRHGVILWCPNAEQ